jgi:hypothetical protein
VLLLFFFKNTVFEFKTDYNFSVHIYNNKLNLIILNWNQHIFFFKFLSCYLVGRSRSQS